MRIETKTEPSIPDSSGTINHTASGEPPISDMDSAVQMLNLRSFDRIQQNPLEGNTCTFSTPRALKVDTKAGISNNNAMSSGRGFFDSGWISPMNLPVTFCLPVNMEDTSPEDRAAANVLITLCERSSKKNKAAAIAACTEHFDGHKSTAESKSNVALTPHKSSFSTISKKRGNMHLTVNTSLVILQNENAELPCNLIAGDTKRIKYDSVATPLQCASKMNTGTPSAEKTLDVLAELASSISSISPSGSISSI
jgi:hypothetical protein